MGVGGLPRTRAETDNLENRHIINSCHFPVIADIKLIVFFSLQRLIGMQRKISLKKESKKIDLTSCETSYSEMYLLYFI